jgi:hypothetical protein
MCFQFIPEESESISIQGNSAQVHDSPLDEIRHLANSLLIDQNQPHISNQSNV